MDIPISHFLVVSAGLFTMGVFGALTRRNAIGILISIELILNSANLNLIAFSRVWGVSGASAQVMALIVIGIAAAGAVVGLALVLAVYRQQKTVWVDEMSLLKG